MKRILLSLVSGYHLHELQQRNRSVGYSVKERSQISCSVQKSWDEGMPLGNATVGVLVWKRDSAPSLFIGSDRSLGFTAHG